MADPLSAAVVVRALKREGLTVVEHRSWRTHNRNHKGAWGPVHGVMIHHTVTSGVSGTVSLCYEGRPDLPGPLCHGVIDKQGRVHLVGHGRANHAGTGDDDVLRAVVAESYATRPPHPNENNTDGNARFYGFECINLGDGDDPWPAPQLDAIERASAALCRAHGWGAKSVIGHLEWTNQKIDPRGFGMPGMRKRVAERLRHAAGWNRDDEEDDVPEFVGLGKTKRQKLTHGTWTTLTWEKEFVDEPNAHGDGGPAFVKGAALYQGTAYLTFDGLPDDGQVQARVVETDAKTGEPVHRYAPGEHGPTLGGEYFAFPITGRCKSGRHTVLQVIQHRGQDVTVDGDLRVLVWRR